jgi:hypothetical protein
MAEKENLKREIEKAREKLNRSIERKEDYGNIYKRSTDLDVLLEKYIAQGY